MRFVKNGYLAVDLFFILSGVVISATYSTKITDIRTSARFIGLRFFRIYPLHFAALTAFVAIEVLKVMAQSTLGVTPEHHPFTGGQSPLSLLTHLFLVQGLGLLPTPGWNGPSWSISCEFVAYLLFAIVSLLGLSRSRAFLVAGALTTAIAYVVLALDRGTLNVVYDLGIVRCLAGFFWGVLIHRWSLGLARPHLERQRRYEMAAAVGIIAAMSALSGAAIVIVIPLFIILVTTLRSDSGPVARILNTKPAQYLGQISYSVYMVHECIVICLLMTLKRLAPVANNADIQGHLATINPWIGDILVFAVVGIVIVVASFTYSLIEQPGRLFGRRILGHDALVQQSSPGSVGLSAASPCLKPATVRQQ